MRKGVRGRKKGRRKEDDDLAGKAGARTVTITGGSRAGMMRSGGKRPGRQDREA